MGMFDAPIELMRSELKSTETNSNMEQDTKEGCWERCFPEPDRAFTILSP
jgi:hypothetical protein